MADTTTTEPSDTSSDEETQEEQTTTGPTADDVAAMQRALKKANKEAEQARLRLKEREDQDKSESERSAEKAAEAEKRALDAERALMRLTVAAKQGIPPELADRLHGDTEEEMAADAEQLLAVVRPRSTSGVPAGPRGSEGVGGDDMNALLRRAAGRG